MTQPPRKVDFLWHVKEQPSDKLEGPHVCPLCSKPYRDGTSNAAIAFPCNETHLACRVCAENLKPTSGQNVLCPHCQAPIFREISEVLIQDDKSSGFFWRWVFHRVWEDFLELMRETHALRETDFHPDLFDRLPLQKVAFFGQPLLHGYPYWFLHQYIERLKDNTTFSAAASRRCIFIEQERLSHLNSDIPIQLEVRVKSDTLVFWPRTRSTTYTIDDEQSEFDKEYHMYRRHEALLEFWIDQLDDTRMPVRELRRVLHHGLVSGVERYHDAKFEEGSPLEWTILEEVEGIGPLVEAIVNRALHKNHAHRLNDAPQHWSEEARRENLSRETEISKTRWRAQKLMATSFLEEEGIVDAVEFDIALYLEFQINHRSGYKVPLSRLQNWGPLGKPQLWEPQPWDEFFIWLDKREEAMQERREAWRTKWSHFWTKAALAHAGSQQPARTKQPAPAPPRASIGTQPKGGDMTSSEPPQESKHQTHARLEWLPYSRQQRAEKRAQCDTQNSKYGGAHDEEPTNYFAKFTSAYNIRLYPWESELRDLNEYRINLGPKKTLEQKAIQKILIKGLQHLRTAYEELVKDQRHLRIWVGADMYDLRARITREELAKFERQVKQSFQEASQPTTRNINIETKIGEQHDSKMEKSSDPSTKEDAGENQVTGQLSLGNTVENVQEILESVAKGGELEATVTQQIRKETNNTVIETDPAPQIPHAERSNDTPEQRELVEKTPSPSGSDNSAGEADSCDRSEIPEAEDSHCPGGMNNDPAEPNPSETVECLVEKVPSPQSGLLGDLRDTEALELEEPMPEEYEASECDVPEEPKQEKLSSSKLWYLPLFLCMFAARYMLPPIVFWILIMYVLPFVFLAEVFSGR